MRMLAIMMAVPEVIALLMADVFVAFNVLGPVDSTPTAGYYCK